MHAVRENAIYRNRNGQEVKLTSLDPRKPEEANLFDEGYRFWAEVDKVKVPFTAEGNVQLTGMIAENDLLTKACN